MYGTPTVSKASITARMASLPVTGRLQAFAECQPVSQDLTNLGLVRLWELLADAGHRDLARRLEEFCPRAQLRLRRRLPRPQHPFAVDRVDQLFRRLHRPSLRPAVIVRRAAAT